MNRALILLLLTILSNKQLVQEQVDEPALPICPFAWWQRQGIDVARLPSSNSGGASGVLLRVGSEFAIGYSAHLSNEGFERFSVAHELGHFHLPGHPERVLAASEIHQSHAGFRSDQRIEREADRFLVGLLMPRALFVPAMQEAGKGSRRSLLFKSDAGPRSQQPLIDSWSAAKIRVP